jgi:hypothetical protein
MYVHTTPPRSLQGYALALTLFLKVLSGGSLGMSKHAPATSNFQPWYTQRRPRSWFLP